MPFHAELSGLIPGKISSGIVQHLIRDTDDKLHKGFEVFHGMYGIIFMASNPPGSAVCIPFSS